MKTFSYVTYEQVEQHAKTHYLRYGTKTGFKTILQYLFDHQCFKDENPDLPSDITWSNLTDQSFYEILNRLPVKNGIINDKTQEIIIESSDPAIAAESIMPEYLEVYALKYIRYIVEKMHVHNFFEVNYVMTGKCRMIFENETKELTTGSFCIIAPYSRHDVTVDDDSIVISLMLRKNTFETTFFKLLAQEDLLAAFFRNILYSHKTSANYMLFSTDNSEDLRNAVKDIFMECHVPDLYSNTCVISRIHLLFSLLLRRYSNTIQFYNHQQNEDEHGSFIQVLQYIKNHYQTIDLEKLSEVFHYNPTYLSRMIKKNTGKTFLDILTDQKMSQASELLLNTTLKIEDIAERVGYQSVDHFSRLFKKIYGTSPSIFRKNAK